MPSSPQTFFHFASEHTAVITELYYTRDGVSEPDLRRLIVRHERQNSPGTTYMVGRLLDLRIIETCPGHDARYEMTRACAVLMEFLLSEYRLTDVAVIQAYLTALDSLASEFGAAVSSGDGGSLARTIIEMEEHVERMRQDSAINRSGVIAQVMRIKSNPEGVSIHDRYDHINRLWNRFISPLREMVDTNKAMEETLDRVELCVAEANTAFELDGTLHPRLGSVRARLARMRRELISDFSESIREVLPLYEELRRENTLARGAAFGLEMLSKGRMSYSALGRRFPVSSWRPRECMDDGALRAYLTGLRGYRCSAPRLALASRDRPPEHVHPSGFDAAVRAALPIADALKWLMSQYPDQSLGITLRLYGKMRSGHYGDVRFGLETVRHQCGKVTLESHPVILNKNPRAA